LQEQEIHRPSVFREPPANIKDSTRFAPLTRKLPAPNAANRLALDVPRPPPHNFPVETRCSQCNAPMTCKKEEGCWCAELPHVIPMPAADAPAAGCLCRNCLLEKIKAAGASSAGGIPPTPNSSAPRN